MRLFLCLSACLPVYLSACLPVCLSACLPACVTAVTLLHTCTFVLFYDTAAAGTGIAYLKGKDNSYVLVMDLVEATQREPAKLVVAKVLKSTLAAAA